LFDEFFLPESLVFVQIFPWNIVFGYLMCADFLLAIVSSAFHACYNAGLERIASSKFSNRAATKLQTCLKWGGKNQRTRIRATQGLAP
jgi:hypothetical protein